MEPDGIGVADDALNVGFTLGYQNNRYLSAEFEYTDTFIKGETRGGNDWDVTTFSAYAALRSDMKKVRVKGKLGLSSVEYGNGDDDFELSAGIGIGFRSAGTLTEVEYTQISDDLDFVSVGVNFFF